jgi:cytidylate kinase
MITCPNCGDIAKNEIEVYNEALRKQSFGLLPILPTCKRCGAEVAVSHTCNGGNIIVLNGTCGSGKSTVAELLVGKGFLAIDGDCVMQTVKHKRNIKKVDFSDMFDEIAAEIDILSLFSKNLVLSHVILPEDMDKFIEIFESRKMRYQFILLKPEYQTAVERCQTRTCHTSITGILDQTFL